MVFFPCNVDALPQFGKSGSTSFRLWPRAKLTRMQSEGPVDRGLLIAKLSAKKKSAMWPFRTKVKTVKLEARGPADFGPFAAVFGPENQWAYYSLLHLEGAESQETCKKIYEITNSSEEARAFISLMLSDVNWRPHLVACIATLTSPSREKFVQALWDAFDAGSWVAPQLAVVLSFSDLDYEANAKQRIENLCPVLVPVGLDWVKRHSATGPAGTKARSGKNLASLLETLTAMQVDPEWVSSATRRWKIRKLLKEDFDGSAHITRNWLRRVCQSLEPLSVCLQYKKG